MDETGEIRVKQEHINRSSDQVACASFDYMKLMVVEMQQQLNELEDRERIGGGEGGDPKPPPRGRANPFNSGGEVFFDILCMWCAWIVQKAFGFTRNFLQQGRKVRKGWREVHIAAGRRVQVESMHLRDSLSFTEDFYCFTLQFT